MALYFIKDTTLTNIADAIRSKTGSSDTIPVDDMATQILSITGGSGGSGSMGDHTITFMSEDGSAVLCEKPVMHGDTCGDPISLGLINTPTKESTTQYQYIFNGWSTTAGDEADSTALANVTFDRTVYAVFTEGTHYYTVCFYDGDTLLETQQVAYGATPSYSLGKPEKFGHIFTGWTPAISTITGDVNYYAEWSTDTSALFQLQEIAMAYDANSEAYRYYADNISVTNGEQYLVTWDGVDYICEARTIYFDSSMPTSTREFTLGNPFNIKKLSGTYTVTKRKLNDKNGEDIVDDGVPFFIEASGGYVSSSLRDCFVVYTQNSAASHTLRIGTLE